MRLPIFFGWTLLLASPVLAQGPTVEVRAERCKIAIAYADVLLSQLHDRVVFTQEGEQAYSHLSAGGWFSEDGSPSVSPPGYLLRAANRRGRVDALSSCPSMARELRKTAHNRRVVVSGSTVVVDGIDKHDNKEIRVGITLPVMSPTKKSAILFSSQMSGPLAAGMYAYYMTYSPKKGWVVVSSKGLAVA